MDADADADDDQDSRCSASQYVQVRPPEPRILFQNRSYLSLTVRGYTTQSAFCNLGVVIMVVVVIVTMLDDFSPHDPFSEMFHLTIFFFSRGHFFLFYSFLMCFMRLTLTKEY